MSLFQELKRRNVFRVGIAYAVASWFILQLTDVVGEILELPPWGGKLILFILAIGFVLALIFAWAFELTPEGIKRDHEVDRSESIAGSTGQKLNRVTIALLALIAAYFIWEARFKTDSTGPVETVASTGETNPASSVEPPLSGNSIAVLPFANRSNVDDDLFFTDGIHDDLLTQLAKIGDLKVISRTSVMEYRDTTKKIPDIAAELGVGIILEGGVQRAGDRVRINAQLIDVSTDEHLWAETFDREMTIDNIFDIQSEITRQIVTAIKGELSPAEQRTITDRPTDNLEAWESYLHVMAILREPDYNAQKFQRAEPWAIKAVEYDPEFAEAWAQLADIRMQGIWIGYANTVEQRQLVVDAIEKAAELAPDNATVIAAQANFEYRINTDYETAFALYDEAYKLAPGSTEILHYRGTTLRRLGRWEEAIQDYQNTLELDPLNAFAATTMIETLWMMNDFERMGNQLEKWLQRNPESVDLVRYKARLLMDNYGDLDGAEAIIAEQNPETSGRLSVQITELTTLQRDWDRLIEIETRFGTRTRGLRVFNRSLASSLGFAYTMKGDKETARTYFQQHIDDSLASPKEGRVAQSFLHQSLAEAYAYIGEFEQALSHSEKSVELLPIEADHVFGMNNEKANIWVTAMAGQRDEALDRIAAKLNKPEGFSSWQLYLGPQWDFFRDDPRFNELVLPPGVDPQPFTHRTLGDGT